jgi:alpha-beta hydrolase superfamily lysophospholipase
MNDISRPCSEHTFASFDATPLFYRHWAAPSPVAEKKAVILFHRGHEHGGRMAHLVDEFDLPDVDFFAWDARGLGRSPGERGYAEHFGVLVKDVDAFVRHVSETHGIQMQNISVVAQSVGAVIVSAWVHDYAPQIRATVLASPAFKVKLYVPFARPGLALLHKLVGKFFVNSYVKAHYLTHDEARIASYNSDPLITRPIAVNILLDLYDVAERLVADAAAIHVPTQMLTSGADWVVHRKPQETFFERLGSVVKEMHMLDGFYHDTLGEKERHLAVGKARDFLLRQYGAPMSRPDLSQADSAGYTRDEFDRLSAPPASMLMRAYWAMSRFWIGVGGRLSDGIRVSLDTGFDSGSTLDYIYRNKPAGLMPFGRMIDRIYINSIGWRGIRIRKDHLGILIGNAIDRLEAAGQQVRIVDIAAGHGRYVLEAIGARRKPPESILLRDYSPINVKAGRALIEQKGLTQLARFEEGNAFDKASLAAIRPHPTLAVVSGLYELFPENALIETSLQGLAAAVEAGGWLVYTNQPWHPQLELIARSLTSHRGGKPWVMRRRTQAEMDQLVENAGFDKVDQLSDRWGIFSVSLARKRPSA